MFLLLSVSYMYALHFGFDKASKLDEVLVLWIGVDYIYKILMLQFVQFWGWKKARNVSLLELCTST